MFKCQKYVETLRFRKNNSIGIKFKSKEKVMLKVHFIDYFRFISIQNQTSQGQTISQYEAKSHIH
jgi:hypothetical protein